MSSRSKYSDWRSGSSRSAQPEIDFTSPGLAVMEVERLLFSGKAINSVADEVWPKLYIGDIDVVIACTYDKVSNAVHDIEQKRELLTLNIAENLAELQKHHFTHILNCAQSSRRGGEIYDGMGITYLGIDAQDTPTFDMSAHFKTAAEFIHKALKGGGKILVHCHVGVSRSATIVLAYLMLKHSMTLVESINMVKEGRGIIPNRGFLRQLIDHHIKLYGYRNK